MKNIIIKIFFLIILITLITTTLSKTYALSEVISGGDAFIEMGKEASEQNEVINGQTLKEASNSIYNTLFLIGIVVAVIVGMILGIQFITGSVEQKSKIKEAIIPYVVGCVVIFGAFGIWKLVITILR